MGESGWLYPVAVVVAIVVIGLYALRKIGGNMGGSGRASQSRLLHWPESGFFFQSVAGVSHKESEIASIARWHEAQEQIFIGVATLKAEPDNAHDPLAAKVLIADRHVGYIPKEDAPTYRRLLLRDAVSSQNPPTTTAAARITRMLFENRDGYSVALDMSFSNPPVAGSNRGPRVAAPALMPRFYDSFSLKDGCLVVLSLDVDQHTAQCCYAGAPLDIWMPKASEDVYAYAPNSEFGRGKVFVTDMGLLRKVGFKSVDEFKPIVHTACGSMVLTYAKLPVA